MGSLYRAVVRPVLFRLPAEAAHGVAALALGAAQRSGVLRAGLRAGLRVRPPPAALAVDAMGLRFASPIGVAAGFDKAAGMYNALGALGFAFVEVGTVTALPQPGNPRPRLFRLPADGAIVNRMGFNNPGAVAAAAALRARPPRGVVLGVNLGKSKATPVEAAAADYAQSARALGPHAGYVVVNVSSPNTPGLRQLQAVDALRPVLLAVRDALREGGRAVPLLVKIAPDLADDDVDAVADLALALGIAGVVATNTTVSRAGLRSDAALVARCGPGGLSGPPLRARTLAVVRRLRARAGAHLTIVGVGGVQSADDAWALLCAGASLVQVYTGLIYEGPGLAGALNAGLWARLQASGAGRIADVIGADGGDEATRARA